LWFVSTCSSLHSKVSLIQIFLDLANKMLTSEQKQFYKDKGFILLDKVFSPEEIEECVEAYDNLFETKKADPRTNMEAQWAGGWKDNSVHKSVRDSLDLFLDYDSKCVEYLLRFCQSIISNVTRRFSHGCFWTRSYWTLCPKLWVHPTCFCIIPKLTSSLQRLELHSQPTKYFKIIIYYRNRKKKSFLHASNFLNDAL